MTRRYLTLMLALLYAALLPADSITSLQLRNRPAAEVVPIVEPLLAPGDRISGQGFKIFLRASPQTIAEIRELVASLDIAATTLLVSVFQGRRNDLEERAISGSIRIDNDGISADLAAGETQRNEPSGPVQRLRINDGSEGFIASGASSLLSTAPPNAASGFYVLPRLNGDRVTLQVRPFRNNVRAAGGVIDTLQATTTISGRLGEWLPLGGVSERIERTRSDGVSQHSRQSSQQDSIWIRIDLAR